MAVTSSGAVGAVLVATGLAGMFGAITGRLTAMMAALFYPHLLVDTSGNSATQVSPNSFLNDVGRIVTDQFGL